MDRQPLASTLARGVASACRAAATPAALALLLGLLPASAGASQEAPRPLERSFEPLRIVRIQEPIEVDGDLSDPAWQTVEPITTWYETNPGDNIEPKVRNVAWLAYDDSFFYAAFRFHDPDPSAIKAPLGDRDHVASYTDYGGIIVDPRNDGKTAQMFFANPRGIQYDAISSDASGEDSSPDFYWDSAGRIDAEGWTLEIRIPFSSLRYERSDPEQWRIMLYRNMPREFRYQMFTSRLPRESSCFICNSRPLVGLAALPSGSHWIVAPYATGSQASTPRGGVFGSPLDTADPRADGGIDAKWMPNPNMVFDATINPDFSQIESDVARISANERFALFFPERRPFFLESIDLFSTPLDAVYTRTFNQPLWGARSTGQLGDNQWTVLIGRDEGEGGVIIPGVLSSGIALQDFESTVAIARWRRNFGDSFASFLYSGRDIEGGGNNHVFGPDFRWQPTPSDTITGQLLYSRSETPNRPDLAAEWDGRELDGFAGELWWARNTPKWDFFAYSQHVDEDFRADNGFMPQVGFTEVLGETGRTFRPQGRFFSRLRLFNIAHYKEDEHGNKLELGIIPGFGMDAKLNSFWRMEFAYHELRAIERVHERWQLRPQVEIRPGRVFSYFSLSGRIGQEVDWENDRRGHGINLTTQTDIRPTDHLLLTLNASRAYLDVTADDDRSGRLFTQDILRLRAAYTFSARSWLRLIGQWVRTERDPLLYTFPVSAESEGLASSAVFAYKLNWQTVLFLGWADNRALLSRTGDLEPADQSLFLKVSYAFQG